MSAFTVVPARLRAPELAAAAAAELLSGAARALRRHDVDTGRADSAMAVSLLVRTLTAAADALAHDAQADAEAVRAAAGVYAATERRAMAT